MLLLGLSSLLLQAQEAEELFVGAEIGYPPYSYLNEQQEITGFSIELVNAVLNSMEREYRYKVDTWNQVKNALTTGEVDLLPIVGRTPEREELYDFTFPYLVRHGTLVTRNGEDQPESFENMEGKTIGVMSGDNAHEFLLRSSVEITIVETATFEEALRLLDAGKVDGVVMQRLLALNLIEDTGLDSLRVGNFLIPGLTQNFCIAVKVGNHKLLELLNEGLATVMQNGTYDILQKKWFLASGKSRFYNSVLVIGGASDYPPYEYLNEKGQPAGYNVALTRAIAKKMGLTIEIRLAPWEKTYQDLQEGNIDLVQGLFYSESRAKSFLFTPPHTVLHHSLFTRTGVSIQNMEDLNQKTLLVLKDDIMDQYAREENLGAEIRTFNSLTEGLLRFSKGEGDALLTAEVPTLFQLRQLGIENIEAQNLELPSLEYGYGAVKGNERLIQLFAEGLNILKESGEYREIYNNYLGTYEPWYHRWESYKRWAFTLLGSLALITLLILSWILSLRKQVKKQTKRLERKTKALEISEETLSYVLEDILNGYWDWNIQKNQIAFSPGFQAAFEEDHLDLDDPLKSWKKLIDDEYHQKIMDNYRAHISSRGEIPFYNEVRFRHKKGFIHWVILTGKVIQWDSRKNPLRMIGCFIDISPLKNAEERQSMLSQGIEQMMEEVIITTPEGIIEYVNPAFENLTGYSREEAIGSTPQLLNSGQQDNHFYEDLWAKILNGERWYSKITNKKKDGSLYYLEKKITPIKNQMNNISHYISIGRDISREKKMEAQLLHSERMEAIGQLAGGIAHDFNNILTGIIGYSDLAMMDSEVDGRVAQYLQSINTASERAKGLVEQILTFSRQSQSNPKPMKLKPIVNEVLGLLKSTIPSTIHLDSHFSEESRTILADQTKIHELVLNIATNAIHAMDEKGNLGIYTEEKEIESEFPGILGTVTKGNYLILTISDTGKGIPESIKAKIFEPFFTTKTVGEGTGMGLAVSLGIIEELKGNIILHSEEESGTIFHIYLPQIFDGLEQEILPKREVTLGSERILFVDDEEMITSLAELQLSELGYEVHCFNHSQKAWTYYQQHHNEIDLVVTDQTMPEMTGLEFTQLILEKTPSKPIILCTGYSSKISSEDTGDTGLRAIMFKPVSFFSLAGKIREIMDYSLAR